MAQYKILQSFRKLSIQTKSGIKFRKKIREEKAVVQNELKSRSLYVMWSPRK